MEWAPLWLSIQVALLATLGASVIGIAVGALLASRRIPGTELIDTFITVPMILPPTVLGYYVLVMVGRQSAIGRAFESITGTSIVFTRTGVVLAAMIGALPLIVKSSRAALEAVDPILLRAARTLGAGPYRTFFTVTLPLASRGIVAGLILGFARALGDFGVTLMLSGNIPGETQTASLAIYDAIQSNREDHALGMIVVLSLFAVATLYVVNRLTRHGDGHG